MELQILLKDFILEDLFKSLKISWSLLDRQQTRCFAIKDFLGNQKSLQNLFLGLTIWISFSFWSFIQFLNLVGEILQLQDSLQFIKEAPLGSLRPLPHSSASGALEIHHRILIFLGLSILLIFWNPSEQTVKIKW